MMPKQLAHTSPGSVLALRKSTPGSPAAIVARLKDGVIGYKALAALPREKAILDIERPDLMMYEPHYSYSPLQRSLSPRSLSPPASPENSSKESRDWPEIRSHGGSSPGSSQTSRTHSTLTPTTPTTPNAINTTNAQSTHTGAKQHFHRPENGSNIYKKPPIYRQVVGSSAVPQGKHLEDLIIEFSKFPAAQRPDPNQPSKIETEHWPCPPSVAVIEKESRKKERTGEDEEDEEDKLWDLRVLRKQELNKIQSNLGKIILKEELESSAAPLRRKTRSLPDKGSTSKAPYFPASSGSILCRSAEEPAAGPQNGEILKERGTSLPSVLEHKVYPYHLLVLTQHGRRRLPPDVDRTRLESYLSQQEFFSVFGMSLQDFRTLSQWRRNELKKKFGLF
ncbi:dematin-like isoform X2 [Gouania willdenowi]|uniref:dematin-like isoform X2 n=1 Tax=Gouania willdenowi TaxID=441366 RepID=UPI00105503CE|nr:dematin-like isoform X2 [Gouania willdenowi]XP_028313294.1 dematin-like isoform X2 [Gouania willdenowi]